MTVSPRTSLVRSLSQPVTVLPGVGPERQSLLGKLGVVTVEDLLLLRPRRYENRDRFLPIRGLRIGEPAVTRGKVVAMGVKWFRKRQRSIFELILDDGTARLHCRWWNLPYMEKYFATGDEVVVYGKPLILKPRTIDHPETEVVENGEESFIHLNRITPIYPLTEGLPQRWLRSLIWRTLAGFEAHLAEPWPQLQQCLNLSLSRGQNQPNQEQNASDAAAQVQSRRAVSPESQPGLLLSRATAIRWVHFPESPDQTEQARRRLALDEFIELQLRLQLRRKKLQASAHALPCSGDNRLIKPFLAKLGFKLTQAQTEVLREIRADLSKPHPMRRLLQGDVGSGKTVVAACSALMALESGYNVALMSPTEILAEQHYNNFRRWFGPLGIRVELQTGAIKTHRAPERCRRPEATGGRDDRPPPPNGAACTLYVGTQALIQPGFTPDKLGLVIIDEQQKFGVSQREELVRKGDYPHLLVMTATPIPRTLGLTVYGDLDLSVIHESPPGRGQVKTFVRSAENLPAVWRFIREQLKEGQQAYVVYPRVEESQADVKAVVKEFDHVRTSVSPFQVGLLHGRLTSAEKEAVTEAFRSGAMQVLLATSLVEVGLDVPNATIMLIENAEQFGLAQLHQLRGRIGRGARKSFCILVACRKTDESAKRLQVLAETCDGFRIAEEDLRLRGPGELLGQEQSGMPKFRFGDLCADFDLLQQARALAAELLIAS